MSGASQTYVGDELTLFQHATHWKGYLRRQLAPFLRGHVLEVGAGLGGTTRALLEADPSDARGAAASGVGTARPQSWCGLEPDAALAAQLERWAAGASIGLPIETVVGTLRDLAPERRFDAVLYIDVLEHIEDDAAELRAAAARLAPGGALIVLAPAHQWLYSPFDRAIGHFRRYDATTLRAAAPPDLAPRLLRYLDAVGLLASAGNRLLLAQSMPTPAQIRFWDGTLVPLSRVLDPLLAYRLGKSVLGVWTRA